MKIRSLRSVLLLLSFASAATLGLAADSSAKLPPPWQNQDIGSGRVGQAVPPVPVEKFGKNALFGKGAQIAGNAKHADGAFTLQGTMDIWGPMDGGQVVWQKVQGDIEIVARVTSMDNPGKNAHAKAGLCIRESLDGASRSVTQCITPVDGSQFLYRAAKAEKTDRVRPDPAAPKPSVPKEKFPCWLKLVRKGNVFTGYESLDGETWWHTGTITLDLQADALVCLTTSSHTTNTLTTAVFDHVTLSAKSK
jgi:hypothetical protein